MGECCMTNWQSKYNPNNRKPQTPHPTMKGYSTSGSILVDEKKRVAWQATWNKKYAGNWEERGGKLYPRESESKP
jgi:hypothetical protein